MSRVLQKKRVFWFVCFRPFLAAGGCFFTFFGVFLFFHGGIRYKCILWSPTPCGREFFRFFPSCQYQVVLHWGAHIYGRCGIWDVTSTRHGMNVCKCACKSRIKWQIEVQRGPRIYRRCGIWDVTSICHGMYTCNRRSHSR